MPADIIIRNFSLSQSLDSHSWTAQIVLASKSDWHKLQIDESFNIDLNGVIYVLVIDNKQLQRTSATDSLPVITAVSPVALFDAPRAEKITRTWTVSVSARSVVEDVLKQSVDWQFVDWVIEPNRLAFTDATPLEIARAVVESAGGVLRSNPDGSVKVVKRYPARVQDWYKASPDHTLSDYADNVTITEQLRRREVINQVYVSSESSSFEQIQMQVDSRPDGLNAGKVSFTAGDSVGVLVFTPKGVVLDEPQSSSGQVFFEADQTFEHTDDLSFSATDSASLTYPANIINNATWLGNDLGAIGLDTDRQTARIASAGVGVCRVIYTVTAKALKVDTESAINDITDYPVQLHVEADGTTASSQRSIIGQRGDGTKRGVDISDPILTDINALLTRAEMELNEGESLQPVSLQCIYREGLEIGQIAQIEDAEQDPNWRGMVSSITHQYNGIKTLTSLDILRL